MSSGDPNIQAALDAARRRVRDAVAAAIDPSASALKSLARSGAQGERAALAQAVAELLQSRQPFLAAFEKALREAMDEELSPKGEGPSFHDPTDWKAVGLVDENQVEERLAFERVGQCIGHECEAELRELSAYTGEMLGVGWADPSRNPLRGNLIGAALNQAIETIVEGGEARRVLVKEVGQALAKALRPAFRSIVDDFAARGFREVDLAVRAPPSPTGPGGGAGGAAGAGAAAAPGLEAMRDMWEKSMLGRMPAGVSAAAAPGLEAMRDLWEKSMLGRMPAGVSATAAPGLEAMRELWEKSMLGRVPAGASGDVVRAWEASIRDPRGGRFDGSTAGTGMANPAVLLEQLMQAALPGALGIGAAMPGAGAAGPAAAGPAVSDGELMRLLRRLNGGGPAGPGQDAGFSVAGSGGGVGASGSRGGGGPGSGAEAGPARSPRADAASAFDATFASSGAAGTAPRLSGNAETNLIRAHHDELVQASPGQLDHMVIEVVASLFDQILADTRVPPQIAREIARLQLPVLRVALRDTSFFSSRKHPVRRFINRISTLATSFGELESGPGKDLLGRVNALVTEIVEGDFDQVPLYARKLGELEQFVAAKARSEFESSPAAATLQAKEAEWQMAQRFGGRLQETLEPLPVAPYLKEFLAQVWSRAIVAAAQGGQADPAREQRFRKAAFELVASIQPKRSAEQRSQFLAGLRGLTATLDEGLGLIGWPKDLHDAFFGKLIADHSGSLKAAPGRELDHNMLMRQLDAAARTPLPDAGDASAASGPGAVEAPFEPRFSAGEAERLGLLDEAAVDWTSGTAAAVPGGDGGAAADDATPGGGADLDLDLATRPAPFDAMAAATADPHAFPAIVPPPEAAARPAAPVAASEPEEPTEGPQLRHHLQIGASYRLQLKDQWEKVRLTYMHPGRGFFLFAHGSDDRGTISMTARMLERLCETRRLKAFEERPLIDRATERMRAQPAAAPAPAARSEELSAA